MQLAAVFLLLILLNTANWKFGSQYTEMHKATSLVQKLTNNLAQGRAGLVVCKDVSYDQINYDYHDLSEFVCYSRCVCCNSVNGRDVPES